MKISGHVQTIRSLDRETINQYTLNITVLDPSLEGSDYCIVTVNITDVNDCEPKFVKTNWTFSVLENEPTGSVIGRISAVDDDLGFNGEVWYQIVDDGMCFLNFKLLHIHKLMTFCSTFHH